MAAGPIAKSIREASHIRLATVIPGRLLHLRHESIRKAAGLIAGYQFMGDRSSASKDGRAMFWDKLDCMLQHTPETQHSLIVAGDWTCIVGHRPLHTGSATFRHRGQRATGPHSYDQACFERFLVAHSYVALNSFGRRLCPTDLNHHHVSRIDLVRARISTADGHVQNSGLA